MSGCALLAACVLASASAGAGTARPPVSLVASPQQVTLVGKARQTVTVTNSGSSPVVVDVRRAGFALDLRGRPRIVAVSSKARAWVAVRPRRLELAPGGSSSLAVASILPRHATPGDHGALVLLTTRPVGGAAIAVRMRLGVVVVVRVPGRIVRKLALLGLRVRRAGKTRLLDLSVANRGNVREILDRRCLTVTLHRGGRMLARVVPVPRSLLPRTRGIAELRYRGPIRGAVQAVVRPACAHGSRRVFRIRL